MRKSKSEVGADFTDPAFFDGDDIDELEDLHLDTQGFEPESDAAGRRLPARQRIELRKEQQSLRRQLSDWDDYDDDFESPL